MMMMMMMMMMMISHFILLRLMRWLALAVKLLLLVTASKTLMLMRWMMPSSSVTTTIFPFSSIKVSRMNLNVLILIILIIIMSCCSAEQKKEQQRMTDEVQRRIEFYKRGYTWPPSRYVPDTPGWRRLSNRRMDQALFLKSRQDRYTMWMQTVASAYTQPNFTDTGWGLTRAPSELVQLLRTEIKNAYDAGDYVLEDLTAGGAIAGPYPPLYIDRPALRQRVLEELLPYHEAWISKNSTTTRIPLIPNNAYGFRVYQNQSQLYMHIDNVETHIISCILHIDSSGDAKPWPLVLEDYEGNTNEIILTPGDMLLYESSKCVHGRPIPFHGSWYSSIFVHYYPQWTPSSSSSSSSTNNHDIDHLIPWSNRRKEAEYGIPPHWAAPIPTDWALQSEQLELRASAMVEPTCRHTWCNLQHSTKISGPGIEGKVRTANNVTTDLIMKAVLGRDDGQRGPLTNNEEGIVGEPADEL